MSALKVDGEKWLYILKRKYYSELYKKGKDFMPFCKSCGKEISSGVKFCPYCGAAQDINQEATANPEKFTKEEMEEIEKIKGYLEPDEKVLLVARQSRVRPGGSLTTPNIIFATDRKLIVRNPMMLGLRESVEVIPYSEITSVRLKKGVFSSEVMITAPGLTTELGRFFRLTRHGVAGIPAIPKDKAEKLVVIIREGMKRSRIAKMQSTVIAAPSPLEELKKLKELLDMGAITKEEYEEKKKEILKRI